MFLDEVGDLPFNVQVKFLRALDSGEYRPVGSTRVTYADIRQIAATHRDLAAMLEAGTFRKDIFYRLHAFEIRLPPLRDRKEDLPLLIQHFLERSGCRQFRLTKAMLARLLAHHWPGNVRELQYALCRYMQTGKLEFEDMHQPPPPGEKLKPIRFSACTSVRQETEHFTPEEYLKWIRTTTEELIAKYHLKLKIVQRCSDESVRAASCHHAA